MNKNLSLITSSLILTSILNAEINIKEIEYSIDDKKFQSPLNLTSIDGNLDSKFENINSDIDITGLNDGLHEIYFRVKNSENIYSEIKVKSFKIGDSSLNIIVEAEYSIDDSTFLKAIKINPSDNKFDNSLEDFNFDIDISNLNIGSHKIYFRVKNSNGDYSLIQTKTFFIAEKIEETEKIEDKEIPEKQESSINVKENCDMPKGISKLIPVDSCEFKNYDKINNSSVEFNFFISDDYGTDKIRIAEKCKISDESIAVLQYTDSKTGKVLFLKMV